MAKNVKNGVKKLLMHPLLEPARRLLGDLSLCLVYHRVLSLNQSFPANHPQSGLVVSAAEFDRQMEYLSRNYCCLDLATAVRLLRAGRLPERAAVVTFDDGYKDNLTVALPILEKYDVPATIYVCTGIVEGTAPLWWYDHERLLEERIELEFAWRERSYRWPLSNFQERGIALGSLNQLFKTLHPREQSELLATIQGTPKREISNYSTLDSPALTWDEVRTLDKHPLITIGAHTKTHPVLSTLSYPDLVDELREGRRYLEDQLGHPVFHFAYPFGSVQEAGVREYLAVRKEGYRSAVTTTPSHLTDKHAECVHALPRIAINYDDTLESFCWKLSGIEMKLRGKRISLPSMTPEADLGEVPVRPGVSSTLSLKV